MRQAADREHGEPGDRESEEGKDLGRHAAVLRERGTDHESRGETDNGQRGKEKPEQRPRRIDEAHLRNLTF